jgi:hypothetical protein
VIGGVAVWSLVACRWVIVNALTLPEWYGSPGIGMIVPQTKVQGHCLLVILYGVAS